MAEKPPTSEIPRQRRARRNSHNEAVSAIPATVLSIFSTAASTGDTSRQTRFYKDCRILDSRLDAVSSTRTLAVQGRPVVWKPPPGFENDRDAKETASLVSRAWNATRRTVGALGHLAHGSLEGHAGLAMEWGLDPLTRWTLPRFLIDRSSSDLFVWHPDTLEPWFSIDGRVGNKATDTSFPLSDERYRDQFIFFSPIAGRADYPWRRGALRACVIRSILKRLNIGHWTALLERWGQPQVVAIVDYDAIGRDGDTSSDSESLEDEIQSALRAIGRDWRASFPKGVEIKEIAVNVAEELHKKYVDWANTEDAIAVLGQNLSTEAQGGSFAAASAHNRIRIDILASDCAELAEALTDQWAERVVRYNRPGSPVPYAEFVLAPRREWTIADYQGGACTLDELRTSNGHEQTPDERGKLYSYEQQSAAVVKSGTPAANPNSEPSKPSDTGEPGPSKPEGGDPKGAAPAPKPDAEAEPAGPVAIETEVGTVAKVADAALNGAQMAALDLIVSKVEDGLRAPTTAIEMITAEFASIDRAKAETLVGTIKPRSTPTPSATQPAMPADAAEE